MGEAHSRAASGRILGINIKTPDKSEVVMLVNPRVLTWKQIRLALALLDQLLIEAGLQLEATHATTTTTDQIDQLKQTFTFTAV